MKAAVLEATRTMTCKKLPTPEPGEGQVLVRVAFCGVCGSDVPRYLDGAVHNFPLVLGHEFSGRVEKTGPGVDETLAGKRVSGVPLVPCMECPDCQKGDFSLCKHYGFIGSRQQGAYAEYVCVPARNVVALPDEVSDIEGAFFEPASVAQHAVNMAHIPERLETKMAVSAQAAPAPAPSTSPAPDAPTAAVVGCGTIGIFLAQILQSMGLRVWALARRDSRIEAARAAGVQTLCNTSVEGWDDQLKAQLPRSGFDYVFDTSGNGTMMVKSLDLAANKAFVCMVGTPKRDMRFTVREWENLNRKELTLTGSWMSYSAPWPGCEWRQVAEGFASGALKVVDAMIDSTYSIEEISGGMEKFAEANAVSGKILVDCR